MPVITAVHGFFLGGGIGICGACDMVIASDDADFRCRRSTAARWAAPRTCCACSAAEGARRILHRRADPAAEAYRLGAAEKLVPRRSC